MFLESFSPWSAKFRIHFTALFIFVPESAILLVQYFESDSYTKPLASSSELLWFLKVSENLLSTLLSSSSFLLTEIFKFAS